MLCTNCGAEMKVIDREFIRREFRFTPAKGEVVNIYVCFECYVTWKQFCKEKITVTLPQESLDLIGTSATEEEKCVRDKKGEMITVFDNGGKAVHEIARNARIAQIARKYLESLSHDCGIIIRYS